VTELTARDPVPGVPHVEEPEAFLERVEAFLQTID
jgi:hypothetical protein